MDLLPGWPPIANWPRIEVAGPVRRWVEFAAMMKRVIIIGAGVLVFSFWIWIAFQGWRLYGVPF